MLLRNFDVETESPYDSRKVRRIVEKRVSRPVSFFFVLFPPFPLLSTKNLNLTKCRLVDVIKGLKSIAFFTKYLIISSIMISSPLTQKKYTTN